MLKRGKKIFLGKPFISIYGKPFGPSCSFSLSRLKHIVFFLIFSYQLLPYIKLHMAVLGNPSKWAVSLYFAWQSTLFFPFGHTSIAFFGNRGCNRVVWWCFLSAECVSMLFLVFWTEQRESTAGTPQQ